MQMYVCASSAWVFQLLIGTPVPHGCVSFSLVRQFRMGASTPYGWGGLAPQLYARRICLLFLLIPAEWMDGVEPSIVCAYTLTLLTTGVLLSTLDLGGHPPPDRFPAMTS